MTNTGDVLAADIGGTNLRLARVQADGHIVQEVRVQTHFSQLSGLSGEEAAQVIADTISQATKPLLDNNIAGLGIGFPGFFIGNSGILASSPNIPQLENFNLAEQLSKQLNLPVSAQNDALCAAVGEQTFGAGKGTNNLLHITLGTGIGGGLILNNQPYTGESGMAMEFGHLRVVHGDDARFCGCGNRGCVEAYASATAISARYTEISGETLETKVIFDRATHGDNDAKTIIKSAGTYLGQAIAEAIKLLDIHTVTISGGMIGAWDIWHPNIKTALDNNLIPPLKGRIQVLPSALGDNAGLLGAAKILV
ncbi:MAG: ROK family protein [Ghiorsea sp.]|nr:ROK family protein [Ghiorsea sp.]